MHAASIVLSSFFAGLAIGYVIGTRLISKINSILAYAVAEVVVFLWAMLIPLLLAASRTPSVVQLLSNESFAMQLAYRGAFAFLLLLPATIAMGATLPFIAEYISRIPPLTEKVTERRKFVSYVYAINTFGAFLGVCFATFFSLVNLGVTKSSLIAAAVSAACAILAYALYRKDRKFKSPRLGGDCLGIEATIEGHQQQTPDYRIALSRRCLQFAFAFLSGFGTLALQVLYLRMFSLVFHNSTYTFGLVVAVFIVSLALGAALAGKFQKKFDPKLLLGAAASLGAIFVSISVTFFAKITKLDYFSSGDSFITYLSGALCLVALVVAPAIVCLGMILPLTWALIDSRTSLGRSVGSLTAVNTIAGSLGAIVTSFVLLFWTGLWGTFVLIAAIFFCMATTALPVKSKPVLTSALFVVFFVTSFLALNAPTDSAHNRSKYDEQLLRRWNSSYGWIDLVQRKENGVFKIRQNLHYRFGATGTNAREYRQAHIPLLLHKDPKHVLFLGLGTGLTAGGAVPHSNVQTIEVVELIPEVVEAAELLAEHNFGVVGHEKVTIHVDDARHHLLAHDAKYDVIISDLFVPWESESGYLYTVEHYEVAASRLNPDGLFCQWLPLYQLGPREFELIANSFASVFPSTTIWWAQLEATSPVIALIGRQKPMELKLDSLNQRIDELQTQLQFGERTVGNAQRLVDLYHGDWQMQKNAFFNTDEYPRVEFLTPVSARDQNLLRGNALKQYYDRVLGHLPSNRVMIQSETLADRVNRRGRQRAILFGIKTKSKK